MKNHQFITTATMAAVCAFAVTSQAAVLSPEKALARVETKLSRSGSPVLVHTGFDKEGSTAYYVFDREVDGGDAGFMIVSASDATDALLGYSDSGTFSPENMPPQLKWWLGQYAEAIAQAEASEDTGTVYGRIATPRSAAERREIAPITVTTWDQGSPYNDLCPSVEGKKCYTGCVATATAQVMKVHNWPVSGFGSNSYEWSYTDGTTRGSETLSMDFSSVRFDWDNMADSYSGSTTATQKEAVATLMHAVGVGVSMQYGTSESGAVSVNAAKALLDYFGYDLGLRFEMREYYGLSEWEDIVYASLEKGMPVLMGGRNDTGGHEFVCDGYSSDGFFHFNWGWSGLSDGYYKLMALNPESQGAGGTTSGYNYGQDAILNVTRPAGGVRQPVAVGSYGKMECQLRDDLLMFTGQFINITPTTGTVQLGVRLTDENGNETCFPSEVSSNMTPDAGYKYYGTSVTDMPDGTYNAYPVYSIDGGSTWLDMKIPLGLPDHAVLEFASNSPQSVKMATVTPLEAQNVELESPVYIGSMFKVSAKIVNPSSTEALQNIYVAFAVDNGFGLEVIGRGYDYPVDVEPGASQEITYQSVISQGESSMEAGEYMLVFVDSQDNIISEPQTVTVNAAATTAVSAVSWKIDAPDLNAVDRSSISVVADVACTEGYYAGPVHLFIFPLDESGTTVQSVASFASAAIFLSAGQSQTVTFTGAFPSGVAGKQYFGMLRGSSGWLSQTQINFRLDDTSGLDDIYSTGGDAEKEYYTIGGIRVSSENLPAGLYIVRQGNKVSKHIIR